MNFRLSTLAICLSVCSTTANANDPFQAIGTSITTGNISFQQNMSSISNNPAAASYFMQDESGQVVIFFEGEPKDNSGPLVMCIAYQNIDDASDNISGQRFAGSWNTIGDNQNRISLLAEGFSLQMNIAGETRGSEIPSEQQIISLTRNPNELYGLFRLRLNEDSATWHSDDTSIDQSYGLLSASTAPSSDSACTNSLSFEVQ